MPRTRHIVSLLASIVLAAAMLVPVTAASASQHSSTAASKHRACVKHAKRGAKRKSRSCVVRKKHEPRAHTATRAVSGGLIVGLVANASGWGGDGTSSRLDQISSQTGAKWLREEFFWNTIEPSQGQYDFSVYDHFMLVSAQKGFHVLPLLDNTPAWAGGSWNSIPTNPSDYAAFVAAVVTRYGPHGSFWTEHPSLSSYAPTTYELWNEPYQPGGDNNTYDPGRYARLVKAATTAGRAADPSTKYLLEDEVTGQQIGSSWVQWVDQLYQAVPDLNHYFDGVAIHPYGSDVTGLTGVGMGQIRRTELIRAAFVSHGAADKPLWITEIGWPTCSQGDRCVTAAQQATDMSTLFKYLHGSWSTYVQAAFIYNYQDIANDPTNAYDNYGLTNLNGTPKPALARLKAQDAAATPS